jgi:hypothetical protein
MFACCELGFDLSSEDNDPEVNQTLDLLESASTLSLLLHLLHNPLESPTYEDEPSLHTAGKPARRTLSAIPFPLLPQLLLLADKYILRESIPATLLLHLEAHAATHPLHVYGLAISHGLSHLANKTTAFLLSPSLHTYSPEAVAVIPSVKAYHRLVRLHAYRVESLRKLVKAEEVFPHGYGACAAHLEKTNLWWSQAQDALVPLIEAGPSRFASRENPPVLMIPYPRALGTDVAAEMAGILDKVKKCPTCHKACTAAVEMLAVSPFAPSSHSLFCSH